ncbi:ATP synthase mitochondrial F1 complex assembly factor 2-like [Tripterygium wilfordii]|uniref:ATP synthase mitochondrial F1 complex assembly factor 2-like n=1 Tax=Tripterygium wilfordii TaxID=458696 RepID=A0A7J7DKX3_TRIWF|nr:ATP synthase mitochondrial F1 complex assembly factor 2-like [Tripterygium wilfordii]
MTVNWQQLMQLQRGAHSLIIAIGICHGKLGIEQAIELVRLEEDLQSTNILCSCIPWPLEEDLISGYGYNCWFVKVK